MQNTHDIIIQALTEKVERLQAENENFKTPPIENALNTVFGINPQSTVDFDPNNASPSNRYKILSEEYLQETLRENMALKAENKKSAIDKFGAYFREVLAENERLKAEKERLENENVSLWSQNNFQWKNSEINGTPDLNVGDTLLYCVDGEMRTSRVEIEFGEESVDYFIIPAR